jgi:hypothetical protein
VTKIHVQANAPPKPSVVKKKTHASTRTALPGFVEFAIYKLGDEESWWVAITFASVKATFLICVASLQTAFKVSSWLVSSALHRAARRARASRRKATLKILNDSILK